MAEKRFTKQFKEKLKIELSSFLTGKKETKKLIVETEFRLPDRSLIDIIIYSKFNKGIKENSAPNKFIAIEIEIKNNRKQIERNYINCRKFVFSNTTRIGALLHLISTESNITTKEVGELLFNANKDTAKGKKFYFDMYRFDIEDMRASNQVVENLFFDWEFEARLKSLLLTVFNINI